MSRPATNASLTRRCRKLWGKIILAREPLCIVCRREIAKEPHHIFPWSKYTHLRFDLRNGAALCTAHHFQVHHDPVRPILRFQAHMGDRFNSLVADAYNGRRKNPYGKKELASIETALKVALEEL